MSRVVEYHKPFPNENAFSQWLSQAKLQEATVVSFSKCYLGYKIGSLCTLLMHNTTVTELYLDNNNLDQKCMEMIVGMLKVNRSIKLLDLSGNRLGLSGYNLLMKLFDSPLTTVAVEKISLSGNSGIEEAHIRDLVSAMGKRGNSVNHEREEINELQQLREEKEKLLQEKRQLELDNIKLKSSNKCLAAQVEELKHRHQEFEEQRLIAAQESETSWGELLELQCHNKKLSTSLFGFEQKRLKLIKLVEHMLGKLPPNAYTLKIQLQYLKEELICDVSNSWHFWNMGFLDFYHHLPDSTFYACAYSHAQHWRNLAELKELPHGTGKDIEVVVIDDVDSFQLQEIALEIRKHFRERQTIEERYLLIAKEVFKVMGGHSHFIGEVAQKKWINAKSYVLNITNVMPNGMCLARGMLFKYMCDKLSTKSHVLMCRLVRGFLENSNRALPHVWNVVLGSDCNCAIVDTMNNFQSLQVLPHETEKYNCSSFNHLGLSDYKLPANIKLDDFALQESERAKSIYYATLKSDHAINSLPACVIKKVSNEQYMEARLMSKQPHPNLMPILQVFKDDQCFYLLMERMQTAINAQMLKRLSGNLNRNILPILLQVAFAIRALHRRNILHRDIKPENVLINLDQYENVTCVKVADLGISRYLSQLETDTSTKSIAGSTGFIAPEAISMTLTLKLDVYSFGQLMGSLFAGREPGTDAFSRSEFRTEQLYHLYKKCTDEHTKRPTMEEVTDELKRLWLASLQ